MMHVSKVVPIAILVLASLVSGPCWTVADNSSSDEHAETAIRGVAAYAQKLRNVELRAFEVDIRLFSPPEPPTVQKSLRRYYWKASREGCIYDCCIDYAHGAAI